MGRGKLTLSLEDYERFLHNPNDVEFSLAQLNQIVCMHGFKKIHRQRKNVVFESLNEINLTKPHRSTLDDVNPNRAYDSLMSLQQVKDDVAALNWQECQVHSIVSVGLSEISNGCEDMSRSTSFSVRKRRSKRKRGSVWMTCHDTVGDVSSGLVEYLDTYNWEK